MSKKLLCLLTGFSIAFIIFLAESSIVNAKCPYDKELNKTLNDDECFEECIRRFSHGNPQRRQEALPYCSAGAMG